MSQPAKISVELQLLTDKVLAQIKALAPKIAPALNVPATEAAKITTATDKATSAQDKLEKQTKKTTSALQKQLEEWRKLNAGGIAPGQQTNILSQKPSLGLGGPGATVNMTGRNTATPPPQTPSTAQLAAAASAAAAAAASAAKAAVLAGQRGYGMANVQARIGQFGLPTQQFPALPNGQAVQSQFQKLLPLIAAGIGSAGGPLAGAIAGVLTKLDPAVAAVTASMTALRYAAMQTADAFERARNIYAKSIQSGFGQGQTVQRQVLANVIGVSENDIYQYGYAIAQLNEKVKTAIRVISETQGVLTATAWNFQVLKENLAALWATVAAAVAPAVNRLLEFVSAMAKLATLSGVASLIANFIGQMVSGMTRLLAVLSIFPATIMAIDTAVVDGFKWMAAQVHNLFANSRIGKKLGMQTEAVPGFANTKDAFASLKEVLKAAFATSSPYKETAGTPSAFMKQLPASSWERMGLQVGAGGGANYPAQTANNTKRTANALEKLVMHLAGANSHNYAQSIPSMP